ncbi:unnamed protein product [Linum tenue]|uniref:Cytochrome P450 n=1 Tax=Linum tenue TaxID=586396 RepID=A0AAV0M615_9ROSI|nr:unnamed protein product [Linum tenue]
MLFLTFLLFLPLSFLIILRRWSTNNENVDVVSKLSRRRLPPGPWKLPIIGNLHQLALHPLPHVRLRDLALKHGPLMHLQLGEASTVVVSSPEVARRLRKIFALELLSSSRVHSFRSIREEEAAQAVAGLARAAAAARSAPVNLSRLVYEWTSSVTARAAFGGKTGEDQAEFFTIADEILREAAGFSLADVFPSRRWLHRICGIEATLVDIRRRLDRVLDNIISDHRAKRTRGSDDDDGCSTGTAKDLIDVLLKLQEDGQLDFPLGDDSLKAVIMTETSSTTVEWAMSELLRDEKTLKKAQSEVRRVFGSTGIVEEARLGELKYLKLVLKEVLRLRPTAPLLLPRQNSERCEIDGYDVPANTRVLINVWAMGRDPKYWVQPDEFIPERFLDSSLDYKGTNYEFIPFGAGRRMCPGMAFGMANVELQLANLLYHFDWELPENEGSFEDLDMSETFGVTVKRKHDLCLIPVSYLPCLAPT